MYHYIKYSSGNAYILEDVDESPETLLRIVKVISISDPMFHRKIGEICCMPFSNPTTQKKYDIIWHTGERDFVEGMACLDLL